MASAAISDKPSETPKKLFPEQYGVDDDPFEGEKRSCKKTAHIKRQKSAAAGFCFFANKMADPVAESAKSHIRIYIKYRFTDADRGNVFWIYALS